MPTDQLLVLLSEISKQVDSSSTTDAALTSSPSDLIVDPLHDWEGYRGRLVKLRSSVLDPSCAVTDHDCSWELVAFCRPNSTFIQPEILKSRCQALQDIQDIEAVYQRTTGTATSDRNLGRWIAATSCSLVLVESSSQSTDDLGRLGCATLDRIDGRFPTVYMLDSDSTRQHFQKNGHLDLLRQIVIQALRLGIRDKSVSFLNGMVERFKTASSTTDWFSILHTVAELLPGLRIVVDLSVLGAHTHTLCELTVAFNDFLHQLEMSRSASAQVMLLTNKNISEDLRHSFSLGAASEPSQIEILQTDSWGRAVETSYLRLHTVSRREVAVPDRHVRCIPASSGTNPSGHDGSERHHPRALGSSRHASPQLDSHVDHQRGVRQDEIQVAIICALPHEADAIESLCDEFLFLESFHRPRGDLTTYRAALMATLHIVIVYMPAMGKGHAASVAAQCCSSFPRVELAVLAGICGGVPFPDPKTEIMLGDVVIGDGMVLYDFGRRNPDGFQRKDAISDSARKLPPVIASFYSKLKTRGGRDRLTYKTASYLDVLRANATTGAWAVYPGLANDVLFKPDHVHRHRDDTTCSGCRGDSSCDTARSLSCPSLGCDLGKVLSRGRHESIAARAEGCSSIHPAIHFGAYASGDVVMKSGQDRDRIARKDKVVAFEMEGAGIWDTIPCIIVKGVCDYADSHKNKDWQYYAATAAAACVKTVLDEWSRRG